MLSHAQLATVTPPLTVRPARPGDARSLDELAQLDSARPREGDVLLVESGSRPVAAIDVISGRLVADPFRPTAHDAELLRARATQLRRNRSRRGHRGLGLRIPRFAR